MEIQLEYNLNRTIVFIKCFWCDIKSTFLIYFLLASCYPMGHDPLKKNGPGGEPGRNSINQSHEINHDIIKRRNPY